jgi:hypothetical protein
MQANIYMEVVRMTGVDITDKVIRVEITHDMIERARKHAWRDKRIYGFHNSKSYTDDKNRFLGSLGEEVVSAYFKTPLTNTSDYDIILNGEKVEVKSQGLNVDWIRDDYYVKADRLSYGCDKYMFVIVHNTFRHAWIVGRIDGKKFNDNCRVRWYKGDIQYAMHISDLDEIGITMIE